MSFAVGLYLFPVVNGLPFVEKCEKIGLKLVLVGLGLVVNIRRSDALISPTKDRQ